MTQSTEKQGLPVIATVERLTLACPAQWHATTTDGSHVFLHYRYGIFSYGAGATFDESVENCGHEKTIGSELEGTLDDRRMMAVSAAHFNWSRVTPQHKVQHV